MWECTVWGGEKDEVPLLRKPGQQGDRLTKRRKRAGNKAKKGMQGLQEKVHNLREVRAVPGNGHQAQRRPRALQEGEDTDRAGEGFREEAGDQPADRGSDLGDRGGAQGGGEEGDQRQRDRHGGAQETQGDRRGRLPQVRIRVQGFQGYQRIPERTGPASREKEDG